MGTVKSFVQTLNNGDKMSGAAKEALNISLEMIKARFKLFEAELNQGIGPIQKLPGKYLVFESKKTAVNIAKNHEKIAKDIEGIVGQFVAKKTLKTVCNLLTSTLDLILGSFTVGYNESQSYLIVANHLGGLYRIDYLLVQQKIECPAIASICEDIFGSYLIVSSVDKKEMVDENVYRIIIDRQFISKSIREKFLLMKLAREQELSEEELKQIETIQDDENDIKLTFAKQEEETKHEQTVKREEKKKPEENSKKGEDSVKTAKSKALTKMLAEDSSNEGFHNF